MNSNPTDEVNLSKGLVDHTLKIADNFSAWSIEQLNH